VTDVWVPDDRLLGRALLAVAGGPVDFFTLAYATGLGHSELEERADVLRGHIYAIRVGDENWIAFRKDETWSAIRDCVDRLGREATARSVRKGRQQGRKKRIPNEDASICRQEAAPAGTDGVEKLDSDGGCEAEGQLGNHPG
jgi:hypothetical protein